MRVESIITLAGVSTGVDERIAAKDEKQKEAKRIPPSNTSGYITETPTDKEIIRGTTEKKTPNRKDARISPITIVAIDTGVDTSLSKVLILTSHGVIMGTTAVAVKKMVIAIKPDIKKFMDSSLPTMKAPNKNKGSKIPKITTGPLR